MVTVRRESCSELIHVSKLVVGDIYEVKTGDEVPAESVLVQGNRIMIDESAMTGESDLREKRPFTEENMEDSIDSILLSMTHVHEGSGWALVIVVGKNTIAG